MVMRIAYAILEDSALVELAQNDDRCAFDELVRRYHDKMYRLSYKILRHEQDAAEALQDAFLSAYRGIKSFKAQSAFSTWLYRIATNASLMTYRRRRDNHFSLEGSQGQGADDEPFHLRDWAAQPPEALITAETRRVMEQAVQSLHVDLRTVFVLRDIEGMSNARAAAILGLSTAAVKSRLHRARLFLRDWLTAYFEGRVARRSTEGTLVFTREAERLESTLSAD